MAAVEEKAFRQLEDVGSPADISAMKWSPKMDLIAIITQDGAVWLNRLSWQRVWTLRSSDYKVTSLAWRPDGKVLALGLDSGKVHLVNVENSECLHEYDVGCRPVCLDWVATTPVSSTQKAEGHSIFCEKGDSVLPCLPPLPSVGSTALTDEKSRDGPWDPKRLKDLVGTLSFLVIGDEHAAVTMLVHGLLPVGKLNMCNFFDENHNCHLLSASLDANVRFLVAIVLVCSSSDSSHGTVSVVTFDTTLYSLRSEELEVLSQKYGWISSLMTYFQSTFQAMSEAWEDILLETDSQLEKYAESLGPDTSVSEEFLTLFTCGTASPELQFFLLNNLTEKGLKKLGKTVESSYSNIQTLALKNLQSGCNALLYHLNDLMGMAKWYEHFGILGLSDSLVADCLKTLGSLMLKIQELLSVIENALGSFIAFFKWLYLVILQLLDEEVPSFIKRFNQEDVTLVAEFLQYQLGKGERGKSRFSMERVGQYLKREPLSFTVDNSESMWKTFWNSCPELKDASYIFSVSPEKSLVTLHDELISSIDATFEKLNKDTEHALACNLQLPLYSLARDKHEISQFSVAGGKYHWIAIPDHEPGQEKIHIVRLRVVNGSPRSAVAEGLSVGFLELGMKGDKEHRMRVVDFEFYDETSLSLLLRREIGDENSEDLLAQFKYSTLEDSQFKPLSSFPDLNCSAMTDALLDGFSAIPQRRSLSRMKTTKIAVSGFRKVACVLSASRCRVKLFDMDAESEDLDETTDDLQTSGMSTESGV